MKICYWNINKKDLSKVIVDLCCEFDLDILIISEHNRIDEAIIKSRFADNDLRYDFVYVDKESKVIVLKKKEIKLINNKRWS